MTGRRWRLRRDCMTGHATKDARPAGPPHRGPGGRRRGQAAIGSRPPWAAQRRRGRLPRWSACSRPRITGSCPSGTTPCRARSRPATRWPATSMSTWPLPGPGYTGLWTAYYLSRAEPGLKIAVCEREIAGFGASGRNGGWCSALFPASLGKLERMAGRDAAIAMQRAMQETVDEVGRWPCRRRASTATGPRAARCSWPARPPSLTGPRPRSTEAREFGFGEETCGC